MIRRNERVLTKKRLDNIDVSSPLDPLLDVESLGRNVRDINFTLFPLSPLNSVIDQFISGRDSLGLIANLMDRCNSILKERDPENRDRIRREFQTTLYTKFGRYFSDHDERGYMLFSIFNRLSLQEVSPKLHRDKSELIQKLIAQPVLRLISTRGDIDIDPNLVMKYTGVDGFRSIMDRFHLDLRLLTGANFDRLMEAMRSRTNGGVVHFDSLRVWFSVWEEGLDKPPIKGSKWTIKKLLTEIERKQSKYMLIELLKNCSDSARTDVVAFLRRRFSITGMYIMPWSSSIIDEWMIEKALLGDESEITQLLTRPASWIPSTHSNSSADHSRSLTDTAIRSRIPVSVISNDKQLIAVKKDLLSLSDNIVGISFIRPNVLSVSSSSNAYIIDLDSTNRVFVTFLLKKLLGDPSITKVLYSLEAFLDKLHLCLGLDTIHFETVVDMRRGRIRRRLVDKRDDDQYQLEPTIPGIIDTDCNQKTLAKEQVDHIHPGQNLADLTAEFLGIVHDRSAVYDISDEQWNYRPLDNDLVMLSAHDSFLLIGLEKKFRQMGFKPTEVLCFDPF